MPITAAQLAVMKPDDASTKIAQKGTVVTDHQKRPAMLAKHIFHPFNGWQIHMVGRLVKKQDIGLGVKRACQR